MGIALSVLIIRYSSVNQRRTTIQFRVTGRLHHSAFLQTHTCMMKNFDRLIFPRAQSHALGLVP